MAEAPGSLVARIDTTTAARLVGTRRRPPETGGRADITEAVALDGRPAAVMVCPFCAVRAMYDYLDVGTKGRWYHCRRCDFSGDPVELLARARDIPMIDSARLLVKDASAAELSAYLTGTAGPRRAYLRLWEGCRQMTPAEDADAARLCRLLGLRYDGDRESWHEGLGRFVGVAPLYDLLRGLTALRLPRPRVPRHRPTWYAGRSALAVPLCDLPGRPRGVLLFYRPKTDRHQGPFYRGYHAAYVPLFRRGPGAADDPGVAPFAAAWATTPPGAEVFLATDAAAALRLQSRQLAAGQPPLPLVAAPCGRAAALSPPPPFEVADGAYAPGRSAAVFTAVAQTGHRRARRLVLVCGARTMAAELYRLARHTGAAWAPPAYRADCWPAELLASLAEMASDPTAAAD